MSEHTFPHYRTGTCTLQTTDDPPVSVEAHWYREGHIVHLTLPPLEGLSGDVTLAGLPLMLLPSRPGVAPLAGGRVTLERGARRLVLSGAAAGGTMHYLAIPGQAEEPQPEPAPAPAPEPEPEPEPELALGAPGV